MKIKMTKTTISKENPTYFIADIAANHDGDLARAIELIHLAKQSGADCAKFQHFKANKIVSSYGFESLKGVRTHQNHWNKSVHAVYEEYHTREEWDEVLIATCNKIGIDFMTTPYDLEAVRRYGAKMNGIKIGSGDITYHQLIQEACKTGLPIFLATGGADIDDSKKAIKVIQDNGNSFCLMQCNTNYSGSLENFKYVNLRVLKTFAKLFPNVILGLSDHTPGHSAVLGAIALGATVIEKHFTDDNERKGPDHSFALNPTTWREMVLSSRELEQAMGDGIKRIEKNELEPIIVQRRAIRAAKNLFTGQKIDASCVSFLRPCTNSGLPPYKITSILGSRVKNPIKKGDQITLEDLEV